MRIIFLLALLFCFQAHSSFAQILVPKDIGATTPVAWGDYDNDGDMDLLQFNGTALRILKNNLVGTTATFVDAGINLVNFNPSQAGWIDLNNDGYLDIYYLEAGSLKLFVNQGGVSFTQKTLNLSGETLNAIADWGDIDSDGNLDILAYGKILRNVGNDRFELSQSLGSSSRTEFLDFDNDGDLDFYSRDLLYTNKGDGVFELDRSLSPYGTLLDYVYNDYIFFENEANGIKRFASHYNIVPLSNFEVSVWDFIHCGDGGPPYAVKAMKFADFNNDGKKDVLMLRNDKIVLYSAPLATSVDCNEIGSLSVPFGNALIADFDNDGDLDVFIGNNLFENKTIATNAAPSVPALLIPTVTDESVKLRWSAATDDKTPTSSLTYNVIIKRGPDIVYTNGIGANGKAVLPRAGGVGNNKEWVVRNLPKGKYTWSVQAVDAALRTSALAPEGEFEIKTGPDLILTLPNTVKYKSAYNETSKNYLLTYLKSSSVLMGQFIDGKTIQPIGTEFKINTTSGTTIKEQIVGVNAAKNEFIVSWLEQNGTNKRIYAKNILSTGSNLHAEKVILNQTDTLKYFLAGDKVAVDPVSGKYLIPWMQNRTDINYPQIRYGSMETYYPNSFLDVYAAKISTNGIIITNEAPKLLQTRDVPSDFYKPIVDNYAIQSAVDFDLTKKHYAIAWNFLGESRRTYGGGSSGEITSVLRQDDIKLIVTDENLLVKSEVAFEALGSPRNLSMVYNYISDQFMLVWSSWNESTNGLGSNDFFFEVYQRVFSLQSNGTVSFMNAATLVSKPPNITSYGSGLPALSWSKKRNEYLITWNKGIAANDRGVLGQGDIFWRRVSPNDGSFVDSDTRFLSNLTGNETIIDYNSENGHFLLGWRSGLQNYLSSFKIPKDTQKPVVISVSPNKAGAGTSVIITANHIGNMPAINQVKFGAISAVVDSAFPVPGDGSKIRVTVPAGLTRVLEPVTITYDDQVSNATVLFENISETAVTSVAPLEGEVGDVITITGTNFPGKDDLKVLFGSTQAAPTDIIKADSVKIEVKVPQAALRGSRNVAVEIQGIANVFAGGEFRVIRVPVITSIVAAGGEFTSDEDIDIIGSNFSLVKEDLTVKFGKDTLSSDEILFVSNNSIKIAVPRGIEGDRNTVRVSVGSVTDGEATFIIADSVRLGSEVRRTVQPKEFKFSTRPDDEITISSEVYNRSSVQEIKLWTKGISESDNEWSISSFKSTAVGNQTSYTIPESEFTDDPVGLDLFYEVTDLSSIIKYSDTVKIFRDYIGSGETSLVPDLNFGGAVSAYNIVSIPYVLSPNGINTVFKSILDRYGYDKTKWRLIHYQNDESSEAPAAYAEYLDGLNVIEPGKGYWMIVRNQQEVTFDMGRTLNTDGGPFEIVLHKGWNQIGNPYDYNVSWDDIIEFNRDNVDLNVNEIESFKTFQNGAFVSTNVVEKFRGGFVRYNGEGGPVSLKVPFVRNESINGGRLSQRETFPTDLSKKEWRISLDLSSGEFQNKLSSFGMHPRSHEGIDERDEHRLPNFIQMLDFAFPGSLATSIVGTQESYTWEMEVFNTIETKEVTIRWDNLSFGDNDRDLYLHDQTEERLINMREKNSYTFTYRPGYMFNVHFGDRMYVEEKARPEHVVLSDAYPNPMADKTVIPFTVTKDKTHVQLSIYNLQGQAIRTLVNEELQSGYYEFEWDGKSAAGEEPSSGVVIYRLQTSSSGSGVQSINKKLIIAQ